MGYNQDIFVNRDGPKALFQEDVENISTDGTSIRVFHGIGGQGKSALCRDLYRSNDPIYGHLKRAHLDLRNEWSTDAVVLLIRIRNSFVKSNLSFAMFDLALAVYWDLARNEQALPTLTDPWLGKRDGNLSDLAPDTVQTVREAFDDVVKMIPGLGAVARRLTRWGVDKAKLARLKHIQPEAVDRLFAHDDFKQPHELEKLLPWFMAQDLAYHRQKNSGNRFVLFLDEYEGLFLQNKRWQDSPIDTHVRTLINECHALLCVFFSREILPWSEDRRWQKKLEDVHHELKGLTEDYADEWLCKVPIEEADIRKTMIEGAREERKEDATILPFLLELQISHWMELKEKGKETEITPDIFDVEAEHFDDRCYELVDRLLRNFDEPLCNTLRRLSVTNRFDKAAFECVIQETGMAKDGFKKLVGLSFIKEADEGFHTMHRATSEAIVRTMGEDMRENSIDLLLTHYTDRAVNTAIRDVDEATLIALSEGSGLYLRRGVEGYVDWLNGTDHVISESGLKTQLEQVWRDALSLCQERFGEDHGNTQTCYNNLGFILSAQGRFGETEDLYRKGLEVSLKIYEEDHPSTATSYNNLGSVLDDQGRYEEAAPYYQKGLEVCQKILADDHPDTATSYNNVGFNLNAQGRYEEAEQYFQKGLELRQKILGDDHPDIAVSYNNVGSNLAAQERYKEAEPFYRKGLEIRQRLLGEDHPSLATSYNNVGTNLFKQEHLRDAEPFIGKAYDILTRVLGAEHPTTVKAKANWEAVKQALAERE
ncbi:tetratricopeptide repeat protein [Terasakiella sp. A23]|uniref:tetratricopeptide repeat protein n=1 Tax=Terasakiella sp. FCG-A23 TaxID=3080561 RepID=UPI0029548ACD|nr:tetratricopeptide repeat protein [Terasakiella sp. A23]MDV7340690.1 tetratricopeptide repeat protein [Terasakiella sp. A23]